MGLVVVCKSGEGKPFRPVSLEMIDKHVEVLLDFLSLLVPFGHPSEGGRLLRCCL